MSTRRVHVSDACDFFQATVKKHPSIKEELEGRYGEMISVLLVDLKLKAAGDLTPETPFSPKATQMFHEMKRWIEKTYP